MNEEKKFTDHLRALAGRYVRLDLANGGAPELGELVVHDDYVTFEHQTVAIAKTQIARVVPVVDEAFTTLREARYKCQETDSGHPSAALIGVRDAVLSVAAKAAWTVEGHEIKIAGEYQPNSVVLDAKPDGLHIVTEWGYSEKNENELVRGIHLDSVSGEYVGDDGRPAVSVVADALAKALKGEALKPSAK